MTDHMYLKYCFNVALERNANIKKFNPRTNKFFKIKDHMEANLNQISLQVE